MPLSGDTGGRKRTEKKVTARSDNRCVNSKLLLDIHDMHAVPESSVPPQLSFPLVSYLTSIAYQLAN